MNKYVKGVMLFGSGVVSGVIVGSAYVGLKVLSSDDMREVLAKKMADKIVNWVYDDKLTRVKPSRVSYREYAENRFDKVIFDTYENAQKALDALKELCDKYGHASVADLYDIAGLSTNYTQHNHGWYSLDDVSIKQIRDGYVLDTPVTTRINK